MLVKNLTELITYLDSIREARGYTHNALMSMCNHGSRYLNSIQEGRTKDMGITPLLELVEGLGLELEIRPKPSALRRRLDLATQARVGDEKVVLPEGEELIELYRFPDAVRVQIEALLDKYVANPAD